MGLLALIVAFDDERVIGHQGRLPWHLSEDLKRFKALTMGNAIVMGRKTWESIGKPLPGRTNIVISRSFTPPEGVRVYSSLGCLAELKKEFPKVFIIGGGELYGQTLELADELYFTRVEGKHEGDTYFPPFTHLIGNVFALREVEQREGYRFEIYSRL